MTEVIGQQEPRRLSDLDERDLLVALRGGDLDAYEELWCRHHRAALTFAGQVAPGRAEDLASEAFVAVLHTITVSKKGPVDGFRAYLFATMRNTAGRWHREGTLTVQVPDPELLDSNGTDTQPSPFDTAEDSATLISVFRSLPERWQRTLWLAEVEGAPRGEIAEELELSPNAVSALLRRAKEGLRLRWLREHLPPSLRDDKQHAGYLLPELLVGKLNGKQKRGIADHIDGCAVCAEAQGELNAAWLDLGSRSLGAIGFAALGETIWRESGAGSSTVAHAADLSDVAAPSAVTAAAGAGVSATAATAAKVKVLALLAASVLAVDVVYTGASNLASDETQAESRTLGSASSEQYSAGALLEQVATSLRNEGAAVAEEHEPEEAPTPGRQGGSPLQPSNEDETVANTEPASPTDEADSRDPATGRYSGEDWVPYLDLDPDIGRDMPVVIPPPVADPGAVIRPPDSTGPGAGDETGGEPGAGTPSLSAPQITVAPREYEYIAPIVSGIADPLATVMVEVVDTTWTGAAVRGATDGTVYSSTPAVDGSWEIDLSTIGLDVGVYTLNTWQVVSGEASAIVESSFRLEGPGMTLLHHTLLDSVTAELDGLPVDFDGPADGTMCLMTSTNQVFDIPFDGNGRARRFIRFAGDGMFNLRFANCDGDRFGPDYSADVQVFDPSASGLFGGFGEPVEQKVFVDEH